MYDIVISRQNNNSLGSCWLIKQEDCYTQELVDKCLYPSSDFSPTEALNNFFMDVVGDETQVDGIILVDVDDPEINFVAATFGAKYGIEYRDMHTAMHHLIVFDNETEANMVYDVFSATNLDDEEAVDALWEYMASTSAIDIEIDFRDIEEITDDHGQLWHYYDNDEHGFLVLNHFDCYDIY